MRDRPMTPYSFLKDRRGFSLVEMLMAMSIFVVIIVITGNAFEKIMAVSSKESKISASQIEGMVGLELLRRDLVQAGDGLPWDISWGTTTASYEEITNDEGDPAPGVDSTEYNDAPSSPPRAVTFGDNVGFNNSDYLVVKSASTGISETAKKWYTATFNHISSSQMANGDRAIVISTSFTGGLMSNKRLAVYSGTPTVFSIIYPNFPEDFRPRQPLETFTVYGIAPQRGSSGLRMPFNRSDYYIKRPSDARSIPEVCAKQADTSITDRGVGILYRSTANQIPGEDDGAGDFSAPYPLLDCVADMQVVYTLDTSGDGTVDTHDHTPLASAAEIRAQIREVRVYILAQDGGRTTEIADPGSNSTIWVGENFNGVPYGKEFDFTTSKSNIKDWQNYRWRVYTVVANTGNLN